MPSTIKPLAYTRLGHDTLAGLDQMAAETGEKRSGMIRRACEDSVRRYRQTGRLPPTDASPASSVLLGAAKTSRGVRAEDEIWAWIARTAGQHGETQNGLAVTMLKLSREFLTEWLAASEGEGSWTRT